MDNLLFENGQKKRFILFYWGECGREGDVQMTQYVRKQNKTKKAKLTYGSCFNRIGCG